MSWRNKRERLQITFVSHGHWRIDLWSPNYPRKIIKSCVTTDSQAVDDFKAEDYEKWGRYNVRKMGTEALWNEVQRKNRKQ